MAQKPRNYWFLLGNKLEEDMNNFSKLCWFDYQKLYFEFPFEADSSQNNVSVGF